MKQFQELENYMLNSNVTEKFSRWAIGYSGCDGGDIGSPESPSIWVCGIEWGGGGSKEWLEKELESNAGDPGWGYNDPQENLAYIFNRQTMKLLCAIDGGNVDEYESFALSKKPFVESERGYYKMNLYPLSFKNTDHNLWGEYFSELTGFYSKNDYIQWCKENRLPFFSEIIRKHKPKLIICFGKTYKGDFENAFCRGSNEEHNEIILKRNFSWYQTDSTTVAICPFPVNRYGLNSNKLLQEFGERIRSISKYPPAKPEALVREPLKAA